MAMELICRTKAKEITVRKMPRRNRFRLYFGKEFDFTMDKSQAERIFKQLGWYFER